MKKLMLLASLILLLAVSNAYGGDNWKSRDHVYEEFVSRMNEAQMERFWEDEALIRQRSRQISFQEESFVARFRLSWRFKNRDNLNGRFYLTEKGELRFRGLWDFPSNW